MFELASRLLGALGIGVRLFSQRGEVGGLILQDFLIEAQVCKQPFVLPGCSLLRVYYRRCRHPTAGQDITATRYCLTVDQDLARMRQFECRPSLSAARYLGF